MSEEKEYSFKDINLITEFDKGYEEGHNQGYGKGYRLAMNMGYNQGHKDGYDYGFEKGYREGNNLGYNAGFLAGLLEKDIRYHQGYEQGFQKGLDKALNRLPTTGWVITETKDIYNLIKQAIEDKKEFHLLRLCHRDLLQIEQMTKDEKEKLKEIILRASVLGIPNSCITDFQLKILATLEGLGIRFQELVISDSNINYALYTFQGFLPMLLVNNKKIGIKALKGDQVDRLINNLTEIGLNIVSTLEESDVIFNFAGIQGFKSVLGDPRLKGKITLDFGQLADLIMGEAVDENQNQT
jgi:hypothetical protein